MSAVEHVEAPLVVVGAGVAGLAAALEAGEALLLCDALPGDGGSSPLAQGGMAAAVGAGDTVADHVADTLVAGDGVVDRRIAESVCGEGAVVVAWLQQQGVRFDTTGDGTLSLHREAAHRRPRIVHHRDSSGAEITRALATAAVAAPGVEVSGGVEVVDLLRSGDRVSGVLARRADGRLLACHAPAVVLATGGYAHLWERTTAPLQARGDGVAMAVRAGAAVADLEMVQFHPTALDVHARPLPLLTEALRGAGAVLVDEAGRRLCEGVHPDGDLAPRDVVARAVYRHLASGGRAYLDARRVPRAALAFPGVAALAAEHGLDLAGDLLPVTPAAHYCMGGLAVDQWGRTSLPGLWAAGEVASSGLHGANRLASNSLLEAAVLGRRAATDISRSRRDRDPGRLGRSRGEPTPDVDGLSAVSSPAVERVRALLWACAGVERHGSSLAAAADELRGLDHGGSLAAANAITVAREVIRFAAARTESRGAHFRTDHPAADPRQARRQVRAA